MSQRRVVITGASAVATAGLGREAFFDGLLAPAPDERPRNVPRTRPHRLFRDEGSPPARSACTVRLDRCCRGAGRGGRPAVRPRTYWFPCGNRRWGHAHVRGAGARATREGFTTSEPVPDSDDDGECLIGTHLHEVRLRGPVRDHGDGVRREQPEHWQRAQHDPVGSMRRHGHGRHRKFHHRCRSRWLSEHDSAVQLGPEPTI